MLRVAFIALFLAAAAGAPALADEPIPLVLQNHRFTPNVIHVKANQSFAIHLFNKDATADEFDSSALKVEKVVSGNSDGIVRVRPLSPGKYPFMGEYHSATAQGVVIAQ